MSLWYASRLAVHRIAARLTYASDANSSPSAFYAVSDFPKMRVRPTLNKAASLILGLLIRPFMLGCNDVLVLLTVLGALHRVMSIKTFLSPAYLVASLY